MFITDWSFPSRLALKRIKKLNFDKKRCGIVDVDLVDSIDLIDYYKVFIYRSRLNPYLIVLYSKMDNFIKAYKDIE
jgi:hypothetical protein